jgi:hypothetical protein
MGSRPTGADDADACQTQTDGKIDDPQFVADADDGGTDRNNVRHGKNRPKGGGDPARRPSTRPGISPTTEF